MRRSRSRYLTTERLILAWLSFLPHVGAIDARYQDRERLILDGLRSLGGSNPETTERLRRERVALSREAHKAAQRWWTDEEIAGARERERAAREGR